MLRHLFNNKFLKCGVEMGPSDRLNIAKNNWNVEVSVLAKAADEMLVSGKVNYAELGAIAKKLNRRIANAVDFIFLQAEGHERNPEALFPFIKEVVDTVQPILTRSEAAINASPEDVKTHTRWLQLGFCNEFINTHPDMVVFLIKSGFAYQIAGFRNSSNALSEVHTIARDQDGHPLLLVEGKMVRWEKVKAELTICKEYDVLLSKANPEERWTYSEPGICKQDIYHFQKPEPIITVAHGDFAKLLEHAKKFYTRRNPDPKPGEIKDAVIQVCTSVGATCKGQAPIVQDATKKMASHYGLRVITKEGKVFSFGYRRDFGELEHVTTTSSLGQVKGVMAMHDFDELRPHRGRYVTSIAVSSQDAKTILDQIVQMNEEGQAFDMFDANCVKKVCDFLGVAGINVDAKEPLEESIKSVVYKFFRHLPYVGPIVKKIKNCALAIIAWVPPVISRPISFVISIVLYIPNKILTLAKNIFVFSFGFSATSPKLEANRNIPKRRFSLAADLFRDSLSDVNSSRKMLRWQKRHKSTFCHPYTGSPRFSILPS